MSREVPHLGEQYNGPPTTRGTAKPMHLFSLNARQTGRTARQECPTPATERTHIKVRLTGTPPSQRIEFFFFSFLKTQCSSSTHYQVKEISSAFVPQRMEAKKIDRTSALIILICLAEKTTELHL